MAATQEYLDRLRAERKKIHVVKPKKRTTWQRSRMRDLQKAIKIASAQLKKADTDKWAAARQQASAAGINIQQYNQLLQQWIDAGYSDTDIGAAADNYLTAWQELQKWSTAANKSIFKQLFGVDIGDTSSLFNNPYLDAFRFKTGQLYANLTNTSNIYTQYTALREGDWENLGYQQFSELSGMFGAALPTQSEFAQMKAGTLAEAGGATWNDWQQKYEDWRKKRKTLYTGEEAKVASGLGDTGFQAPGLKSQQEY